MLEHNNPKQLLLLIIMKTGYTVQQSYLIE